jgi:uncharacterized protein (TIGR02996 family)
MSHEAFLRAVRENPDDDTARLVYADWLDEHGDPDRAEFIRVQCELAHGAVAEPRRNELKERESEILGAKWAEWTDPFRREFGVAFQADQVGAHYFRRGFIDDLWLDAEVFVKRAADLFALVPFTGVSLRRAAPWAARLAACPWLSQLSSLRFREGYVDPLDAAGAQALAASPHLKRLRLFRLVSQNIGDVGLQALARASWMAGIVALGFFDCGLSEVGVQALVNSTAMPRPYELSLTHNRVGDKGAVALAGCARLTDLRRLYLSNNGIAALGARALINSPYLQNLVELDLGSSGLSLTEVQALRASRGEHFRFT